MANGVLSRVVHEMNSSLTLKPHGKHDGAKRSFQFIDEVYIQTRVEQLVIELMLRQAADKTKIVLDIEARIV